MASRSGDKKSGSSKNKNEEGMLRFLYNPDTKLVMNRSCKSWGRIGLFYLILYSFLALFFAAALAIFFTSVDPKVPSQAGMNSLIKGNPGLGFKPMRNLKTQIIQFTSEKKSYDDHVTQLADFVKVVEDQPCDGDHCFSIEDLGDKCRNETGFGYSEGKPCVLIKMNKVYGWEPKPYDEIPDNIKDNYIKGDAKVTCEGLNEPDTESLGNVEIFPPGGFPAKTFPYKNDPNWRQPLVMAYFPNLKPGEVIQVWCKVWADNIIHHKNDRAGSTIFSLLYEPSQTTTK